MTLAEIVDQLTRCHYTCEAGALENNVAFVELKRMADNYVLWPDDRIYKVVSEDGTRHTGYTQHETDTLIRQVRNDYEAKFR